MENKINLVIVLLVIGILVQIFTLASPYIHGLKSHASSAYPGPRGVLDGKRTNCFDASLNGEQVGRCLGVPEMYNQQ